MFVSYLSPLAPAAVLLLSALILSIILPRLPARWQARPGIQSFGPPVLVGLAVLALFGIRLTMGENATGEGLAMLSGWNFSTAESAAALTVRADVLSLVFLILTLLILLPVTLARPTLTPALTEETNDRRVAGWLVLGAGACVLFVAANGLTIGYAVLIFDLLTAIYWLGRRQTGLSVARLFLGILTATGLALVTVNTGSGILLLGLALWLRLGLYPFIEATLHARWQDYGRLVYLVLSLVVGFYLVIRSLSQPLPGVVQWFVLMTMLLNGLLTWLTDRRASWLTRLTLTEACLILLVAPLAKGVMIAYAVGLILSLVALWLTPRLGKPQLTERGWPWPYLPAVGATLTLAGLPFSLGWLVRSTIYQSLFLSASTTLTIVVILAEGLALSGLVRYWLMLGQSEPEDGRWSVAGIVTMVPFLIPGLGPFVLAAITQTELPTTDFDQPPGVWIAITMTVAGAAGLGYFRPQMLNRLKVPPAILAELVRLRWLLTWLEEVLNWADKAVLRVRVFFEGQHYMGWALFAALVGVLIILLGT